MSNSSLIIDKASIHMNLFRNKSSKVTWPCNQIKMDDKEFKCKGKKQTGLRKFLVFYVILSMTVSIVIPINSTFGKNYTMN